METMKRTIIVLLTLSAFILDLAHSQERHFTPKTVQPLYKKIYTALNNYQFMPQPNYTLCYQKNGQLMAPKYNSDYLKKSFIEEMKNITKELDNTLKNAHVSTSKAIVSHFEDIKKSYEEIQDVLNADDREYDEKMAEYREKWSKKAVKNFTDGLNEIRGQLSISNSNLQDIALIDQRVIKFLTNTCTKTEPCFNKSIQEKLMNFYGYMATVEAKIVVLTVHHNLLQGILNNDENVIPEFKKIMRDSTLRTRDYMTAKEVLKKNLPPPEEPLLNNRKGTKTPGESAQPSANYTILVNNNAGTRITRKTDIAADISNWKQNFIQELTKIYEEIDGIWCKNNPSYIRGECESITRSIVCDLKNNDIISQKNTNEAMNNVLKQWINLLDDMSTFASGKIDGYADIFKSIGLFELSNYDKVEEIYNAAADLIRNKGLVKLVDMDKGLIGSEFNTLFVLTWSFPSGIGLQYMEFSDTIFQKSFGRCNRKSLLEEKLKTYCQSKSTSCSDELIKNQLYDIVEYLATIETKIFFSWIVQKVVQSMAVGHIFATSNNHINTVNNLMENKNASFLRIKDYLNEIHDEHVTLPECKPISWQTRVQLTDDMSSLHVASNRYPAPRGILNFAVKHHHQYVKMRLTNKISSYSIEIQINRTSIEISQPKKNKVKVTGHFLNADKFLGYWIKWAERKVSLGRVGESEPLTEITNVDTAALSHFAISNADWILYDLPGEPGDGTNRETCWTVKTDKVGIENDSVCRIKRDGLYKPGSIVNNKCQPTHNKESTPPSEDYQVLPLNQEQWLTTSSEMIPDNAVIGGINKFGEPLYVCRLKKNRIVFKKHCLID